MNTKPTLLVILGPTGVGKTNISLRLAEHFGCPIVSSDSRQFYRELKIGPVILHLPILNIVIFSIVTQAAEMAAQLNKRAQQLAEQKGRSYDDALAHLLNLMKQGWSAKERRL